MGNSQCCDQRKSTEGAAQTDYVPEIPDAPDAPDDAGPVGPSLVKLVRKNKQNASAKHLGAEPDRLNISADDILSQAARIRAQSANRKQNQNHNQENSNQENPNYRNNLKSNHQRINSDTGSAVEYSELNPSRLKPRQQNRSDNCNSTSNSPFSQKTLKKSDQQKFQATEQSDSSQSEFLAVFNKKQNQRSKSLGDTSDFAMLTEKTMISSSTDSNLSREASATATKTPTVTAGTPLAQTSSQISESQEETNTPISEIQSQNETSPSTTTSPLELVGQSPPTSPGIQNTVATPLLPNDSGLIPKETGQQAVSQSLQGEEKSNVKEITEQVAPPTGSPSVPSSQPTSLIDDEIGGFDFAMPIGADTS